MRDRDRLIFGGSQTDSGQERWSRRSGSPVDSGSMLFQNIKVGAVEPGGEGWYTRRCYPWGRKAGNARAGDQEIGHELPNQV